MLHPAPNIPAPQGYVGRPGRTRERGGVGISGAGVPQPLQPAAVDDHVVVEEREKLRVRFLERAVAGEVEAGFRFQDVPDIGKLSRDMVRVQVGGRIVNYEDSHRKRRQAAQTTGENIGAIMRADGDVERRRLGRMERATEFLVNSFGKKIG
jgi:hypothetical protein